MREGQQWAARHGQGRRDSGGEREESTCLEAEDGTDGDVTRGKKESQSDHPLEPQGGRLTEVNVNCMESISKTT